MYWHLSSLECVARQTIEGPCDIQGNGLAGYNSLGSASLSYSSQCLTYLGLRCQQIARTINYDYPGKPSGDTTTTFACDCDPISSM